MSLETKMPWFRNILMKGLMERFLGKNLLTDTQMMDFIARNTTLHRNVEILDVVDGYEVCVTHDGNPLSPVYKGATVRAALCALIEAGEAWGR